MEVHHHAHTPRKKWTHYFWEFLMLFLAVFCGFLAENIREHIIEHKRAQAYAESFLKDLQSDTADIKRAVLYETTTSLMIDSLVSFISNKSPSPKTGQLYYCIRLASWTYTIDWNKATINQLINSGNLRYFTNQHLVTEISNYNTTENTIRVLEQGIDITRNRAATYKDQIVLAPVYRDFLTFVSMDDLTAGQRSSYIDSLRNTELPLANKDPEILNSLVNALMATKSTRRILQTRFYPKAIKEAIEIMEMLKKEYHLQ